MIWMLRRDSLPSGGEILEPAGDVIPVEKIDSYSPDASTDVTGRPLRLESGLARHVDRAGHPPVDHGGDRLAFLAISTAAANDDAAACAELLDHYVPSWRGLLAPDTVAVPPARPLPGHDHPCSAHIVGAWGETPEGPASSAGPSKSIRPVSRWIRSARP